jgi:hypothetical protein
MLKADKLCTILQADVLKGDKLCTKLQADTLKREKPCIKLQADVLKRDKLCTILFMPNIKDKSVLNTVVLRLMVSTVNV